MSKLNVDAVEPSSATTLTLGASGDTISIPSGVTVTNSGSATGFGKVLQVVSVSYNTLETTTSATFSDTGLEASITPSATSSKVMVMINASIGSAEYGFINLVRDSTNIDQGISSGSRQVCSRPLPYSSGTAGGDTVTLNFLDSPSTTSSTTYKMAWANYNGAGNALAMNSGTADPDGAYAYRGSSNITLMEIAG